MLLRLEAVSRSFGGLRAVREVDLGVAEGEILGLIGPNGAGKTTLFNLITGVLRPTSGRVVFGGRDVTALPPPAVAFNDTRAPEMDALITRLRRRLAAANTLNDELDLKQQRALDLTTQLGEVLR